jgi:hypothetical protein
MRIHSTQEVISSAWETMRRFPASLASATLATGLACSAVGTGQEFKTAIMAAMLGILWFTSAQLFAESRPKRPELRWGAPLAAAALLTAFIVWGDAWGEEVHAMRWIQYLLAGFLALWVIPGCADEDETERWWRGARLLENLVSAFFVAVVVFVGVALGFALVKVLFELTVKGETFMRVWCVCALFLAPALFLQGLPRAGETPSRGEMYPQRIGLITRYVLVPIVACYVGLLLLYLSTIVVAGSWPKGTLGYLIAGVASLGLLTRLALAPAAASLEGSPRLYYRYFPAALMPLLALQLLALWRRTGEYGWTENRIFLGLFALWHFAVATRALARKGDDARFVPVSLAALLLISSAGPWSPYALAMRSQISRLEKALTESGALKDGIATGMTGGKLNSQNFGALSHVTSRHQQHRIQRWFTTDVSEKPAPELAALLGVREYASKESVWESRSRFHLSLAGQDDEHVLVDVKGYDSYWHFRIPYNTVANLPDGVLLRMRLEGDEIVVTLGKEERRAGMRALLDGRGACAPGGGTSKHTPPVSIVEFTAARIELRWAVLSGTCDPRRIDSATGHALFARRAR